VRWDFLRAYLTEVTSQFRATAARQIREPRKPLPPKTTIRFVADIVYGRVCLLSVTYVGRSMSLSNLGAHC
jgi:hypothetical protein